MKATSPMVSGPRVKKQSSIYQTEPRIGKPAQEQVDNQKNPLDYRLVAQKLATRESSFFEKDKCK